jgi:hypothetical protein
MRRVVAPVDRLGALALALGVAAGAAVEGHSTRSVSIELVEPSPGHAHVHVRKQLPQDNVDVAVGEPCRLDPLEGMSATDPLHRSMRITCPDQLAGAVLSFAGLGPIVAEAIVVYSFADGRTGSTVVRATEPTFRLPLVSTRLEVARGYVASGVSHILEGFDHLLFLLLLVLNLRTVGAVLVAESAFTLSHSLSFSATALGWIHVAPLAAEACIALSLVLMALEIRCGQAGPRRRGAALAFVFGLVHGLGFAGGLAELGVADGDAAVALLGFAGGVEIGQVLFLAVVLMGIAVATRASRAWAARLEPAAIALIGGLSTYWFIERVALVLAARA